MKNVLSDCISLQFVATDAQLELPSFSCTCMLFYLSVFICIMCFFGGDWWTVFLHDRISFRMCSRGSTKVLLHYICKSMFTLAFQLHIFSSSPVLLQASLPSKSLSISELRVASLVPISPVTIIVGPPQPSLIPSSLVLVRPSRLTPCTSIPCSILYLCPDLKTSNTCKFSLLFSRLIDTTDEYLFIQYFS